jgi:hypothetical protein
MNRPGGYWVVHPSLPWLRPVQHVTLPVGEVGHLLLASDGFYRLVNLFRAYETMPGSWRRRWIVAFRRLARSCAAGKPRIRAAATIRA